MLVSGQINSLNLGLNRGYNSPRVTGVGGNFRCGRTVVNQKKTVVLSIYLRVGGVTGPVSKAETSSTTVLTSTKTYWPNKHALRLSLGSWNNVS